MAGQDASSRATKIPCSRYLLNAKGYLQADRKPSAPRAARSRPPPVPCPKGCTRCCKASPSPGELSVFPEKRLTPGTDAFAQAALIATVCPRQLVVLPAQVTPSCSRLCWKRISEISCHCSTSVEPPTVRGHCLEHL